MACKVEAAMGYPWLRFVPCPCRDLLLYGVLVRSSTDLITKRLREKGEGGRGHSVARLGCSTETRLNLQSSTSTN